MSRRRCRWSAVLILAGLVITGCAASREEEYPAVRGRRVQGTKLVADGRVPYQLRAYELVFAEPGGAARHPRRAALLVDLVGSQGHVQGFAEWGRSGAQPTTYAVGGWARQREVAGEPVTVFELALNYIAPHEMLQPLRDPDDPVAVTVRVAVNEASGDVTLVRRRR